VANHAFPVSSAFIATDVVTHHSHGIDKRYVPLLTEAVRGVATYFMLWWMLNRHNTDGSHPSSPTLQTNMIRVNSKVEDVGRLAKHGDDANG